MKKYLVILAIVFAGCCANKPAIKQDIIYKEGILLSVEPIDAKDDRLAFIWTILTDEGDTIIRYLFKVQPLESGVKVPYFEYKK